MHLRWHDVLAWNLAGMSNGLGAEFVIAGATRFFALGVIEYLPIGSVPMLILLILVRCLDV